MEFKLEGYKIDMKIHEIKTHIYVLKINNYILDLNIREKKMKIALTVKIF